jgi:hypothetical protein
MPEKKKDLIAIAVPSTGLVSMDWAFLWWQILPPAPIIPLYRTHHGVAHARCLLTDAARKAGATHIFFLDSDTLVPPDGLAKFYRHNVPIVTGVYAERASGKAAVFVERGEKRHYCELLPDFIEKGDFVTDPHMGAGLGCCLIRMDVFDRLERPFFRDGWHDEAYTVPLSEDIDFFERVRSAGIPVHCDNSVRALHIDGSFIRYNGEREHLSYENIMREWAKKPEGGQ